ncbi:MAG: hypothetical protein N838_19200 [Thiohalocapsa sp. PB-PSB1]|jgi:hypothetical protein|nr:MAG: hypothetical protein N838_19200 [Thiohalocapsa sp. PB-PSB1]
MRTVDGPARVDVIDRRVAGMFLDPEAFHPEFMLGVSEDLCAETSPMPARGDGYLEHNRASEPLFFVTSPINKHFLTLIDEEAIPEARRQTSDDRALTLIFDREAWSLKSFRRWQEQVAVHE